MTSTPFIEWSLLFRIALVALLAGVGLVIAFSLALVGLSTSRDLARARTLRYFGTGLWVVMGATMLAALVWGFYLIINKG